MDLMKIFGKTKLAGSLRNLALALSCAAGVLFACPAAAEEPADRVQGVVTLESGEPLAGVTVMVEGSHMGVTTDADGRFELKGVKNGTVLAFSFIGMEPAKATVTGPTLHISMKESAIAVEEVVAIGYSTVRKEELTSSVTRVDASDFNGGVTTSPINLISGKVPGLTIRNTAGTDPNAAPEIQLRGVGSIRAGSTPLIIIDGVYSTMNDLQAINAQDIASFNVLKDASSAAIYGTRGSNGVIIVETKNAEQGRAHIDYTSYYYTERAARKLDMMSANQYLDYLTRHGQSAANNDYGFSTDWTDELLRNNFSYYQGVSFSTSGKNSSLRASIGYRNSEGMVLRTGNEQLMGRINFRQDFFNRVLSIEGTASGTDTKMQYTDYSAFMQAMVYHPTAPVYGADGKFFEYEGVGPYNPVAMLSQVDNRGERFNYAGNITATLRPVTGLKVVASLSSNNENYEASKYVSRESRYSILGNYDGSAEMSNYFYKTNTLEAYADYNWTDNVHNFGVMAGYSYSQTKRTWSNASNAGFLTDALGPNNIGNGTWLEEGLASMGRGEDESKLIAFFGRVNYSYKGRYLFNASIRREGSTRFGENNKWGWFPALSGAWRISEEPFMAGAKAVSNLKLRAGFGITGNQDIPLYASISKYNDLGYAYINGSWQKVYGPTTNPNPDLRWEKNTEYNVGVDAGLWDNRLTASVDYYYRKTTDLLDWYDAQVPSSIYNTIFTNVGTLTNQGVEVALGWDAVRRENLTWHIDGNFSYNANELVSLSNDTYKANHIPYNTLSSPANGQTTYIFEAGHPIGTFYGLKYRGFNTAGKWVFEDYDHNGSYTEDDFTYLGSGLPKWNFSLSSSLTWKNLDFSFLFRGAADFMVLNTKRIYYENSVSLPFNLLASAIDSPLNDSAVFSDYYLEKGNYLKLDNLTLGYTFRFPKLSWLDHIRIYATATNLWTITGYTGVDPEVGSGLTPGFDDSGYYPRATTYLFGLNIKF